MTKLDLLREFEGRTGLSRTKASEYYELLCSIMAEELKKDEGSITLSGIGKIMTKRRAERKGRNPRTGETLVIPAHKVLTIRESKEFAQILKG